MARSKKCPQCAETVKGDAKVCRFCGATFPPPQPRPRKSGKKCPGCGVLNAFGAKICASCGTPLPPPSKTEKRFGCLIALVLFALFPVILTMCAHQASTGKQNAGIAPPSDLSSSPSPNSKSDQDVKMVDGMAIKAGQSLKAAMRDPDSLVIEDAYGKTEKHGLPYVCILYRAKNGFGGYNRDHVMFSMAGGDQSVRGWNKYCAGEGGFRDESVAVKYGANGL